MTHTQTHERGLAHQVLRLFLDEVSLIIYFILLGVWIV